MGSIVAVNSFVYDLLRTLRSWNKAQIFLNLRKKDSSLEIHFCSYVQRGSCKFHGIFGSLTRRRNFHAKKFFVWGSWYHLIVTWLLIASMGSFSLQMLLVSSTVQCCCHTSFLISHMPASP